MGSLMGGDMAGMLQGGSKGGGEQLVKSLLKKASRALNNKETRKSIAGFCERAEPGTIMGMAMMAGGELDQRQAERISRMAKGVTEGRIEAAVKWTTRVAKVLDGARKVWRIVKR